MNPIGIGVFEDANTIAEVTMSRIGISKPEHFTVIPIHRSSEMETTRPDGQRRMVIHPISLSQLWSLAPDGTWATLRQDSLAVDVNTFSGETLWSLPLPAFHERTTRSDLGLAVRFFERLGDVGSAKPQPEDIVKPPVYSVYLDPEHRLWVSKTPIVEVLMRTKTPVVDRYTNDGEPPLAVRLPEGVRPHRPFFTAQGDMALGILEDEYGQQTLLIMKIPMS